MTIQTQYATCIYVANGTVTDFEWPYDYDEAMGNLEVFQVDANNNIILQYTSDDFSISGKNVSFSEAPANGTRILIDRHTYRGQQVSFMEGEKFPAKDFENMADRFAMINQEQDVKIDNEITQRQNADTLLAAAIPTKTSDITNDSGFITSSSLPTVNNATLTITQGGTTKGTFTANASSNVTIELDAGGGGGSAEWGEITGTLSDQTDLKNALDAKQDTLTAGSNITISSGTISATDTTYSAFTGADGTNAGTSGLVPAPLATDNVKYLKGNGSFSQVAYSEVSGTPSLATVATTGAYSDLTGTPSLSGYQTTSNLVTSIDSSSTDSQYPSAKLFYDTVGDVVSLINAL